MKCLCCGGPLPKGIKLAFYDDDLSNEPSLGDFCSIEHAFLTLEQSFGLSQDTGAQEILYLGVQVDKETADQEVLAAIMQEFTTRAAREMVAQVEASLGEADLLEQKTLEEANKQVEKKVASLFQKPTPNRMLN